MKNHTLRAFTLIELLVVISIISLLVALILPALAGARDSAQMLKSLANARGIGMGMHTYANDNKFFLPWNRHRKPVDHTTDAANPTGGYWQGVIFKRGYVPNIDSWFSPGHDRATFDNFSLLKAADETYYEWNRVDYQGNYQGAMWNEGARYDPDGAGPQPEKRILPHRLDKPRPTPARHLMIHDNHPSGRAPYNLPGGQLGNPFTYRGKWVRIYMDAHGNGNDGIDLGWRATGNGGFSGVLATPSANMRWEPWWDVRFPADYGGAVGSFF